MNYRLFLGHLGYRATHAALSRRWLPLLRAVPPGVSWLYDVQRFSGRRDLSTFVDAGANVGQTTRHILHYFPDATIHAFEPVSATFDRLRRNTAACGDVRCSRQALGAAPGRTTIDLRANSELNSLQPLAAPAELPAIGREEIEIDTLDRYCAKHAIAHVDVLKLDVQGYELAVFAGAEELLRAGRVSFVYSEVAFGGPEGGMQDFAPLHEFLVAHGFALAGFYEPFRWGRANWRFSFCNALYGHAPTLERA